MEIAADPKHLGAKVGFLAMLHTWGQQLQRHPHIHIIVPGGGLSADGEEWIDARPSFFLSVEVLGIVFRGKFLEAIELASKRGDRIFPDDLDPVDSPNCYQAWLTNLRSKSWVVYSKPPFGGSAKGLEASNAGPACYTQSGGDQRSPAAADRGRPVFRCHAIQGRLPMDLSN